MAEEENPSPTTNGAVCKDNADKELTEKLENIKIAQEGDAETAKEDCKVPEAVTSENKDNGVDAGVKITEKEKEKESVPEGNSPAEDPVKVTQEEVKGTADKPVESVDQKSPEEDTVDATHEKSAEKDTVEKTGEDGAEVGETADENGKEKEEDDDLDDDQQEDNPAYIPKKGRYYMHDSRISSNEEDEEDDEQQQLQLKKSRADGAWSHDRFDERWQRPKSKKQLVTKYGFDIRDGETVEEARARAEESKKTDSKTKRKSVEDTVEEGETEEKAEGAEQEEKVNKRPVRATRGAPRGGRVSRGKPRTSRQSGDNDEERREVRESRDSEEGDEERVVEKAGQRRGAPPSQRRRTDEEGGPVRGERRMAPRGYRGGVGGGIRGRTVGGPPPRQSYGRGPPPRERDNRDRGYDHDEDYREDNNYSRGDRYERNERPPPVTYRPRGTPRGGQSVRYEPRAGGVSSSARGVRNGYDSGNRQYAPRSFHNQTYSNSSRGGSGPRGPPPSSNRQGPSDRDRDYKTNDRDFPPLDQTFSGPPSNNRGPPPPSNRGPSSRGSMGPPPRRMGPPSGPPMGRLNGPPPPRGPAPYQSSDRGGRGRGPKRYSAHRPDGPPQQQYSPSRPRQPTDVVYFDPSQQQNRAPPPPREKKIIEIIPPTN